LKCSTAIDGDEAELDRALLRQVLVNLCSNSEKSGAQSVSITLSRTGSEFAIDVSDDGEGVDLRIRERLFEPYVTTRPVGDGMGLGLAISKKIMLDHGGDLVLIDSAGGATFRLTLPDRLGVNG
jgi:signal transduction histidine kinase